ncbi:MAG: hypothetical protein QM770_02690 [Tepidisphaeraceae bacterium]
MLLHNDHVLLEIHRGTLLGVRTAIDGLSGEELRWTEPATGYSIASEVRQLTVAEHHWLRDCGLDPGFEPSSKEPQSSMELTDLLQAINARWRSIPVLSKPAQYALLRVSFQALFHLPRVVHFRSRLQPSWEMPPRNAPGSWDYAIDEIIRSLLAEPFD